MSWNSFGHMFRFTTWGESHGTAIGCVIDGCPPGVEIDREYIQKHLDRRKPGKNRFTSQRREPDQIEILSGIFQDENQKIPLSTGTPISMIIYNQDARQKDYDNIKNLIRPGHADFTYFKKYGIRDYRGGGRASARETAMRVAVGAVAKKILQQKFNDIKIKGAVVQIGEKHIDRKNWDWEQIHQNHFFCPDEKAVPLWEQYLDNLRRNKNSCGALIEIIAKNVPAGLGSPIYAKLDAEIAHAIMGINAVKSVEIGTGKEVAQSTGKMNNDILQEKQKEIIFQTNHAGGILGGISSGQDINVRFALKPTSSIAEKQNTINIKGENTSIAIKGRHDPCVGIRAVPIAEAMIAIVIADQMLLQRAQTGREKPFDLI